MDRGGEKEERNCPQNYCGWQKEANQMALGTAGPLLHAAGEGGREWALTVGRKDGKEEVRAAEERLLGCKGSRLVEIQKHMQSRSRGEEGEGGSLSRTGQEMRDISPDGYAERERG
ncbi:unnamed protein product [Pleuronectes platessa]|uniref:Uncharacterized protein n=1 Tax=Pleuronectes platessa TaxID=8262 RepID=A0A9N7UPB0_PLEPL|nr:unnamed protein product [Pleuronectes platessa]